MSARVILPGLNLPGRTPHPAFRALWVSGGLLVGATMLLAVAVWHRHEVDEAAQSATAKVLAAVAEQQVPVAAPVAEPARAGGAFRSRARDDGPHDPRRRHGCRASARSGAGAAPPRRRPSPSGSSVAHARQGRRSARQQ